MNNKLLGNLDVKLERIDSDIKKTMGEAVALVQAAARDNCPVNDGELRQSIAVDIEEEPNKLIGVVFTPKKYAFYVENGTGPKGAADHAGISPDVNPVYKSSGWWVHEDMVGRATAEKYRWFSIDTKDGRFYHVLGQRAQPFLYPALKDNEEIIRQMFSEVIQRK